MITGFVFVMMLVVEYLNVLTQGSWQRTLTRRKWGQYLLAAFLGATPGCLGAFAAVTMYSHGILSLGAVTAAMIATSGDESFVMLAMIPKQAIWLFAILFMLAIITGTLTDLIFSSKSVGAKAPHGSMEVHHEAACQCFPRGQILLQWRQCIPSRGILATVLAIFVLALILGWVGPSAWNWIRVTIFIASATGLFIVCTVPDHFLNEHLWKHVARKHAPRIFLWTFGALVAMHILTEHLYLEEAIRQSKWAVLLIACAVGIIPESGPHLIFVTLYAQGTLPFGILLASSIVQDGHGMLPMLAHSRPVSLKIKVINFAVGLMVGAAALAFGR